MKKSCTMLFALIAMMANSLSAQDVWVRKANLGNTGRYCATGFSIGTKGYIGTGDDGTSLKKDFWEFDPAAGTWTQKADFAGTARKCAVGFSIGNTGFLGTGFDINTDCNIDFWAYSPASNTWSRKADFAGIARNQATGFSIGNKGYLGTGLGCVNGAVNDFWEYDPINDKWTRKADFPGGARFVAVSFGIGQKGYIGTGLSSNASSDFWEYDPIADRWTRKADFPGKPRFSAVGFNVGVKGYIGLGSDLTGFDNHDFFEYDPDINAWAQRAIYTGLGPQRAVGIGIGNKGYVGTGGSNANNQFNDFYEYSPFVAGTPLLGFDPLKVTTMAGNGQAGLRNGQGNAAMFDGPAAVVADALGNLYVADRGNHAIRKITADGLVSTFAGNGSPGFVDGQGTSAQFHEPSAIAADPAGNIYVADEINHAIRKITATGWVTTLAGNGMTGSADGTGSSAQFSFPGGIAVDKAGYVYVADTYNHKIRKISPTGTVSGFAGSGVSGTADGPLESAQFIQPGHIAFDPSGNLFVVDVYGPLRKISTDGIVSTVNISGLGAFNTGIVADKMGSVFVSTTATATGNRIYKTSPKSWSVIIAGGVLGYLDSIGENARFASPAGLGIDNDGNVYVADAGNNRIRKISKAPLYFSTVAGTPSAAQYFSLSAFTPARLTAPEGFEFALTEAGPWNNEVFLGLPAIKLPVRLKANLPAGNYNGNLTLSGTGAVTQEMALFGTVIDTTPPTIQCTSSLAFCFSSTNNYSVPSLSSTDVSGIKGITFSITGATTRNGSGTNASGLFNPGTSFLTWKVTDNAGNTGTCQQAIRVDQPLTATIPDVYPLSTLGDANTLYIGFGPTQLTLTAMPAGGTKLPGNTYSYAWSNAATTPAINVHATSAGSNDYNVTITDSLGCQTTANKSIHVVDVRCGNKLNKVLLCWPDKHGNSESCVNENQAMRALQAGARLGSCNTSAQRSMEPVETDSVKGISLFPNPNNGSFVLRLNKLSNVEIRIVDQSGRIIARKTSNGGNDVRLLPMSLGRVSNGLYLLQVISKEAVYTSKILVQQ